MNLFLLAKMSNTQKRSDLLISKSSSSKLHPWPSKFKGKRKGKKALSRSKSGSPAISFLLLRVLHLALLFLEFSSLEIGRIGFLREIKVEFRSIRRGIASCTLLPLALCGIQRVIFYSIPMRCEIFACTRQTLLTSITVISKGPTLLEWMPNFQFDGPLPTRSIPRGRSYSNILFDPFTSLIVAASSLQAKFTSYDEDGNRIWEPEGLFISSCKLSIELIIFLQLLTS